MKKCILIPDSFKGSMSSIQICETMQKAILEQFPGCEVISLPVADGGEGTLDAFEFALPSRRIQLQAAGPFWEPLQADYLIAEDTAILEAAQTTGLPLIADHLNPEKTTSYGLGEIMRNALEQGARKIIVGIGGTSTNDLGTGLASALGMRFLNARGEVFTPTGGTLKDIDRIDASQLPASLCETEVIAICDVDNPLYGPQGAAAIYGPQKGADEAMVARLDKGMCHAAEIIQRDLCVDLTSLPGAGAGGGLGGGLVAFCGAKLVPGIDTILSAVGFDRHLQDCDMVFTGEGRLDGQSLRGKAVTGIARRAKVVGVPVIALVGEVEPGYRAVYEEGVTAIFTINRKAMRFADSKQFSREWLYDTVESILRCLQSGIDMRSRW
jgi:glycerate kinase